MQNYYEAEYCTCIKSLKPVQVFDKTVNVRDKTLHVHGKNDIARAW